MDENIRGIIISPETCQQIGYINEGDRIVRAKNVDYLKDYNEWRIENFFKGHITEISKVIGELSVYEKAFLLSIVPYISYADCHLQYENGRDLGTEDLIKIAKVSRRIGYKSIKNLIRMDILYRGRNSNGRQYFVNPWLFCKGNRINKVLKTMFKNYKIRVMNNVRWKDIREYSK